MKGQAAVETLFTTVFLTAVLFAAIQLMITIMLWLKANEAAQAGLRCALVSKGSSAEGAGGENPGTKAREAVFYILGANYPANTEIWDKPLSEGNEAEIRMFSIHIYYSQKMKFAAHCRMIKPPDWRFYDRAYPGAYNFE
jgi:hypothetical protein